MKTKQLIQELKQEIERLKSLFKERENRGLVKVRTTEEHYNYEFLKAQLQFAEKLIKAIKEDVNGLLDYFDKLRGGMLNRVNVLDFYDELNKILDEALK